MRRTILHALVALGLTAASASAQHAQVSALAVDPTDSARVWTCNRDNDTVSLVDVSAGTVIAEIPVGVKPRSLALSADGTRLFVANQRGNIATSANAVTGFRPNADPGTITVIDTASRSVLTTMPLVGVEPYGVAVAPNGKYLAVTNFRSGNVRFYDAQTLQPLVTHQYLSNLSFLPAPFTVADADENRDGIPDLGEPRGFTITADSTQLYVTHNTSPYVSVLDLTLDGQGLPTGVSLGAKISLDDYAFDLFLNPTPVQNLESQGLPRFAEDIALSPDGSRALIPHLLHNINHDVNHDFGPTFAGDFANRVYPALTVLDAAAQSWGQPGDTSARLEHELSESLEPAGYNSFGEAHTMTSSGNPLLLGGSGATPMPGGSFGFSLSGTRPGDQVTFMVGTGERNDDMGAAGTRYVRARKLYPGSATSFQQNLPNLSSLDGLVVIAQAFVVDGQTGEQGFSNAVRCRISTTSYGPGQLGYRAGHPSKVRYNAAGDRAIMLNRGSEDLFVFDVQGSSLELMNVFPERIDFEERAGLDETTPMGDMPLGIVVMDDTTTANDDALVYVMNEITRTVSSLRVDWATGTVVKEHDQVKTITGADLLDLSTRIGQELFEDASRAQTAGNFNNSCASCHFEGGADGNVWQRPAGPRSTMPVYGGTLGTGLILWKGVRLHLGETGPMFDEENGGEGHFTDAEQMGLIAYHESIPFPLNPNRNPDMTLDPTAALGRDLFFGSNDTGLNPTNRTANCSECHANIETNPLSNPGPRFFTVDFVNPLVGQDEALGNLDPDCFSLRESVTALNIRNVNTGVNVDLDGDGIVDVDRNGDGYDDRETYVPMNVDDRDDFKRDDENSYLCPCDPVFDTNCDPTDNRRIFGREASHFSIPTKLGVWTTGPYFHDHSVYSLRNLVDPASQMFDAVYGDPAYAGMTVPAPGVLKVFNEAHDIRGHEDPPAQPGDSKVQQTLNSTDVDADIDAILRYIQSL